MVIVHDGDSKALFKGESELRLYETPGHNPSCLTMVLGDLVFTGDSYIPGVGVNTRLPEANKAQAEESLRRIMELADNKTILAGHEV